MTRPPARTIAGLLAACLLAAAPGCDGDAASAGSSADAIGADGAAGALSPASGLWQYVHGGIFDNTCGSADLYFDPSTPFVLTARDDGTFVVDQGESAEDFTCTLAGPVFDCPERLAGDVDFRPLGYDAVVSWRVSVTGTLSTSRAMAGSQRVDATCTGAACALAPAALGTSLPCGYRIAFSAQKL